MSIQFDKVQPKTKEQLKQLIKYAFKHNIYDLNFIDTSEITDMSLLFTNCKYDFDISDWDVSNVTDMNNMFVNCKKFNCDLSDWNISNITRWKNMFGGCDKMPIPNWYKKIYIVKNKI